MTISTESTRVEYDGDGGTKPFAVPFKFLDKVDLVVLLRDKAAGTDVVQTLTTHYTVAGAGAASGTEFLPPEAAASDPCGHRT